jgi:competence protein ComEA
LQRSAIPEGRFRGLFHILKSAFVPAFLPRYGDLAVNIHGGHSMTSGIKAFSLSLVLAGLLGCVPAYAAGEKASSAQASISSPQLKTAPANAIEQGEGTVSINSASAEELAQKMNGVGLKKAQAIVSYRDEFGPFKTLEQLQEVPGIGASLVERNLARIKL